MKKITNLSTQTIHLEGFGGIVISEQSNGRWQIDLMPRNYENSPENIDLEIKLKGFGDKYYIPLTKVRELLKVHAGDDID